MLDIVVIPLFVTVYCPRTIVYTLVEQAQISMLIFSDGMLPDDS